MTHPPDSGTAFPSPSVAQRVDNLADRFEAAWKTGAQPRIESYLAEVPEQERHALLQELIALEVAYRRRRGDAARAEDYRARFPTLDGVWLDSLLMDEAPSPQPLTTTGWDRAVRAPRINETPSVLPEGPDLAARAAPWETRPGSDSGKPKSPGSPGRIGRYQIKSTLGSGGFGTVYQAHDDELNRDVAIKVPHPHLLASSEDVTTYLAEARILAGLDHPGILPVYDVGRTAEGLCYLVSKYVVGSTLGHKLQQARPAFAEAAAVIAAVAEALHHAHQKGLVHRDIKPANILLDQAGRPVVADFGLALRDEDFGKGPGFAGTPAYMSPEQARGEAHRVDGRTDIHSLGVIFYEMLTGRRPFRGPTQHEVLEQVKNLEPRPPRQLDDRIPRELERICLKALAKRPADRYSTALDLAEDLRRWAEGQSSPLQGPPDTEPEASPIMRAEIRRLRQELIDGGQRRRDLPREPIVGLRFLDGGAGFKDRTHELAQLRRFLTSAEVKLTTVIGRGGMGKTALVSRLCAEVERGELRLSTSSGPLGADGILYASYRGTDRPTVQRLYDLAARMLGDPHAAELADGWRDPCRPLADKVRLLLSKLQGGTYLLVLDNLEDALAADRTLADPELRAFVDLCLAAPHGLRLLITSRDPVLVSPAGMRTTRTLALDAGLPSVDAVALLRDLDPDSTLGLREAADDLLRRAAIRCHGVPRALEMVAGILAADPAITLAELLDNAALFTERVVENLVSEHYRQIGDDNRRVLEALAVFNQPIPAAALAYLLHPFFPTLDIAACLRDLARGYFVTHHRNRDTYELHPLDREYIYARIAEEGENGRQALHRRAANFYAEMRKPDHEWKTLADIQPHLDRFEHLIQAGAHGRAFWVIEEIDFKHLAMWGHSDLVVTMRNRLTGRLSQAFADLHNGYMLGLAYNRLWRPEEAIACFRTVLTMSNDLSDYVMGDVKGNLGRALLLVGETDEAARAFEETALLARQIGSWLGEGLWVGRRGEALLRLGKTDEALSCHEFALKISQSLGDARWQVTHLSNLGETYRLRGEAEKATRYLQEGLALANSTRNRQGQAYCAMRLARVQYEAGMIDQARDHYTRALEGGLPACNFVCAIQLGMLLLEVGQTAEAHAHLATGADLCRGLLDRTPRLCDAIYALALAHLASGRPEEALATYRQAREVCRARGVVQAAFQDVRQLQRVRPPLAGLSQVMRLLE